jgi:hypothetical protein
VADPKVTEMKRPVRFEHNRWIGDRRTQVVYDVDNLEDASIIDDLLSSGRSSGLNGVAYTCFGPDTLAEARNRGYRPYRGNGSGITDGDDGDD